MVIWSEFQLAWYPDTVYYNFLSLPFVLINYSQTVISRFRISFASHCTYMHVKYNIHWHRFRYLDFHTMASGSLARYRCF